MLLKMAARFKGRAVRRYGELLKEIEPATKYNAKKQKDGTGPLLSRKQAASDAGLSERQRQH